MVYQIILAALLVVAGDGLGDFVDQSDPQAVVGGSAVETCGWPTTVYTGGCTATLVHPKAISTAQHCGTPGQIQFGESAGSGPTVDVVRCVGDGSEDAMLCELAEEVTDLPVTPVLFGCEADTYLQVGQPVVIVGFGQTAYGMGGGTKLWADQTISAVETQRVIIGEAGDGTSPCPGDSGGPVFVQVADGSYRVFGTVLGGTTNIPCNSAANFQRIDAVVGNFEAETGIDITPCFDGQTGAWDPGPDCGQFFAGDHAGSGSWNDWCTDTPVGGYSDECGPAFGDEGGDTEGGGSTGGGGAATGSGDTDASGGNKPDDDSTSSGGETPEGTSGGGSSGGPTDADTTPEEYSDEESGCGCRHRPGAPSAWFALGLLGFWRRRR